MLRNRQAGGRPTRPPRDGPGGGPTANAVRRREAATIGPSIIVKGDLTGSEDLLIEGQVEGTVMLRRHQVTVGPEGRVKADITARTVTVHGEVVGKLCGEEYVALSRSARVQGDISAPRVTIEDGATFRGGIDMQVATEEQLSGAAAARAGGASSPGPATAARRPDPTRRNHTQG